MKLGPGQPDGLAQVGLALLGGRRQPAAEALVVAVDEDLLAGLGVLYPDHPGSRQLALAPVEDLDGDDVVALGEDAERLLPPRLADEVAHDDDEAAAPDHTECGPEQHGQVGGGGAVGVGRGLEQLAGAPEHLAATMAGADGLLDVVVEEHGADLVAAAGQDLGQGGGDLGHDEVLLAVRRPERHRRGPVQEQPAGDLAVLDVLPDERLVHPGRDVPVDVAQVVAGRVLAQVGEVQTRPAEEGPVVTLEPAVEATDDPPLQAAQHPLGCQLVGAGHDSPPVDWGAGAGAGADPVCRSATTSGSGTAAMIGPRRSSAETSSASAS